MIPLKILKLAEGRQWARTISPTASLYSSEGEKGIVCITNGYDEYKIAFPDPTVNITEVKVTRNPQRSPEVPMSTDELADLLRTRFGCVFVGSPVAFLRGQTHTCRLAIAYLAAVEDNDPPMVNRILSSLESWSRTLVRAETAKAADFTFEVAGTPTHDEWAAFLETIPLESALPNRSPHPRWKGAAEEAQANLDRAIEAEWKASRLQTERDDLHELYEASVKQVQQLMDEAAKHDAHTHEFEALKAEVARLKKQVIPNMEANQVRLVDENRVLRNTNVEFAKRFEEAVKSNDGLAAELHAHDDKFDRLRGLLDQACEIID